MGLFLLLLLFPPLLQAQSPRPEDFAGYLVLSGKPGVLLRFELPEEVYRGLERPDRGDLRVFDAAGALVPFLVRKIPPEEFTPEPAELPFFPWNGGEEKALPKGMDIEINTSGGVVRIKNRNPEPGRSPVYLADLSGLAQAPGSLRLSLDHRGNYFNTPVSLDGGREPGDWRAFSKRQILAWYGNSGANRDTLELPAGEGSPYLLIAMEGNAPPLTGILAFFNPLKVPAPRRESSWAGEKSGDGKFVRYRVEGYYPEANIDFALQEPDSIPVTVRSRFDEGEDWIFQGRETLFLFRADGGADDQAPGRANSLPQKSGPLEISTLAPLWELEAAGELSFTQVPRCVVTWTPEELVFLARGEGPWTLRYGNPGAAPLSEPPLDGAALSPGEDLPRAFPAWPGGYEKRAASPAAKGEYGRWILWGVLVLGVVILSVLALSIAGSLMKRKT
jgi:hypothetical protein